MTAVLQSQVFFFISSVGFVILGVLAVLISIAILRALNSFSSILKRAEKDIDSVGDTSREILEDIRDSSVFRLFFQKRRRYKSRH
ncbi:MAG: hypothetical protein NUV59_02240 [Patescibacteria group bacterium]|nr:hypothetical protein [Patescibacteria group bacterium]